MKKYFLFIAVPASLLLLASCKKTTEELQTEALTAYYPMEVGKYIAYKLDSTVFVNFGANIEVHSYEVKYQVDAAIQDNQQRPAYRIIRYIRKTPAYQWAADATFMAVVTDNTVEFIENNERYIKLKQPVRNGYSWKGNSYIDTYSLNSNKRYLADWDYIYDSVGTPLSLGAFNLENTIKIDQRDEVIGFPSDPNSYSEINQGVEKYAKGIGLVYRNFFHSEYQPPTPGHGGYFVDDSYGITLTMIDHN